MNYGLIFKQDDTVYLGKYNKELKIQAFEEISDFNNVYDKLTACHFSFVIIEEEDERIIVKDIEWIIMEYGGNDISIREFLRCNNFPSEDSDNMFNVLYSQLATNIN